jgi:post-segregation antitoxin (ccd killing protein)
MIEQLTTHQLQQLLKAKAIGMDLSSYTKTEMINELEKRRFEIIQDEQEEIELALHWRRRYIEEQYALANTEQQFL